MGAHAAFINSHLKSVLERHLNFWSKQERTSVLQVEASTCWLAELLMLQRLGVIRACDDRGGGSRADMHCQHVSSSPLMVLLVQW